MKNLLIILIAISIMSCAGNSGNSGANEELVNNYVNAVQNLDYEAMDSYLSASYMGYGPSIGDSINKKMAVENWKNSIATLYDKIEYKRSRVIGVNVPDGPNAGEWVSNWAELEITYKENGETIDIMTNTVYMIEDGKIAKSYTFYNEADALDQLGYIFFNPQDLYSE